MLGDEPKRSTWLEDGNEVCKVRLGFTYFQHVTFFIISLGYELFFILDILFLGILTLTKKSRFLPWPASEDVDELELADIIRA